jgi:23S rRNA (guanosine2251-2'-O)-methyltransferase
MTNYVIIENVRSAYNTGNIIRTADALWYSVILSGYTPHPHQNQKIKKTALGSQEAVYMLEFRNTKEALQWCRTQWILLIAAESTMYSIPLTSYTSHLHNPHSQSIAIVVGNEVSWVLPETLEMVDHVVYIPMIGIKESLNVWQAAAIVMWHLNQRKI